MPGVECSKWLRTLHPLPQTPPPPPPIIEQRKRSWRRGLFLALNRTERGSDTRVEWHVAISGACVCLYVAARIGRASSSPCFCCMRSGVYGGGDSMMKARLVWQCANDVFDFLPLGAHLPAARIFCLHGCLGNSIHFIDDLRRLTRPIQVAGTDIGLYLRTVLCGHPNACVDRYTRTNESRYVCR